MGKPGPKCTVCTHPARAQIDLALSSGVGRDTLAQRYGVNEFAIQRHSKNHLSPAQRLALAANLGPADPADLPALRQREGASLLANLVSQRARLRALADAAAERGDFGAANGAERTITKNLETVGRLVGELVNVSEIRNVSLLISPDYHRLRATLVETLRAFPEAGRAVAAALARMESETLSTRPEPPPAPPVPPLKVIEHAPPVPRPPPFPPPPKPPC